MSAAKSLAAALFVTLSFAAIAGAEQRALTGTEIRAALEGNTAGGIQDGEAWKQYFDPNGQTTYVSGGRASPGRWSVRGDKYCSQWPPSERWDCYRMTGDGDQLTFVPDGGGADWPFTVTKGNQL